MRRRLHADRSGTSAIEFAIVMPVFIMLLIAAIAFGQAFYAIGSVQWAMERTARDLMIDAELGNAEFETRLRTLASSLTPLEYELSFTDTMYGEVRVTEVRADLRYRIAIPLIDPIWINYPVTVQAPRPFS